ncbi:ATP synthase F1 subcomplex delta subunit [Jatrophihabitans sp. GAS493]|uniref:F0F1 ATP synthase subunit delta n=1 Tax=Jatrophihabitans sp. GAS493 TaxID=1907575 RepID=UPI000BB9B1E5|nr:F0F1 ATP synthase subunit delta [Jatrophihabitans sp. GAS493]SOD73312.1 ATP synthase F1 subcomplex delta subunit [Jatrophihabitans sp. GAS493]
MIHAASRAALDELRRQFDVVVGSASAEELIALSGELHSIGNLLASQPQLRRALGDASTVAETRSDLISSLLGLQVTGRANDVARAAVALRWSSPWDLADAIELTADEALLIAAEKQGTLDEVEDELFRFERVLDAEGTLTTLFDDATATVARRSDLLGSVIGGKVSAITQQLLEHAIGTTRKRSIVLAIDDLLESAARRQDRSIARVTSAVPLAEAQQTRLAETLSGIYGKQISLRVAIDSSIRGGLIIKLGDEVIDGSVAHKLTAARAALAS